MDRTPPRVEEDLWPRSAQVVAALLVLTTIGLLSWHGYLGTRSSTRPSQVHRSPRQTNIPSVAAVDEESEDDAPSPARSSMSAPARDAHKPLAAVGIRKLVQGDPPIDLNLATATELQKIPGIGPALAARIVERRDDKPFETVEELCKLRGIKTKFLEKIRPFVTVGTAQRTVSKVQ